MSNDRVPTRKRLWTLLKWSLTAVVLAFVALRAASLWRQGTRGDVEFHVAWLVLAGLFYGCAWLPSAWYFKALMARMGDHVAWRPVLRAYYCGHLGKYAPGKALVPIIRGQMVAAAGGRFSSGALAVVYESVVMMGVAAELSIALVAFLLPTDLERTPALLHGVVTSAWGRWVLERPWLLPTAVLLSVIATLPVVGRLFAFMAQKIAPAENGRNLTRRIDAGLIGSGFVLFSTAWVIHGLSLWAVLRGIGANVALADLPTWVACIALSMAAGFFAIFAPGGVGVREGVMIEVLQIQPGIEPRHAVAAAFALRLVGFLTEVAIAAVLYYGLMPRTPLENDARSDDAGPMEPR